MFQALAASVVWRSRQSQPSESSPGEDEPQGAAGATLSTNSCFILTVLHFASGAPWSQGSLQGGVEMAVVLSLTRATLCWR